MDINIISIIIAIIVNIVINFLLKILAFRPLEIVNTFNLNLAIQLLHLNSVNIQISLRLFIMRHFQLKIVRLLRLRLTLSHLLIRTNTPRLYPITNIRLRLLDLFFVFFHELVQLLDLSFLPDLLFLLVNECDFH